MKILEFIEKKELISKFAKEMARLQKKADKYYYIENDKNMSDYILIYAAELKEFANKLGICEEMYQEAYKIYDFRNSGKKEYVPSQEQLEELRNWYDVPTEDFRRRKIEMCEYCNNRTEKTEINGTSFELKTTAGFKNDRVYDSWIMKGKNDEKAGIIISTNGGNGVYFDINYCPICRKEVR